MNFNIAQTLADVAGERPDDIALVLGENGRYKEYSFKDLHKTRAAGHAYGAAVAGVSSSHLCSF